MKFKYISVLVATLGLSACNGGAATNDISGTRNLQLTSDKSNHPALEYESPEHFLLGSSINLKYGTTQAKNEAGSQSILLEIKLNNNLVQQLSFAQIVYLAGDFMGDPETPIGSTATASENMKNFEKNYSVMLTSPARDYLPKIIELVHQQLLANSERISNHEPLVISDDDNIAFNAATGGGNTQLSLVTHQGLYMRLATKNSDHFGNNASASYLAGHKLALELAHLAANDQELKKAYSVEAYAQHFLSDLFASGHLRVPRQQLTTWCSYSPVVVSGFLAKVMHDQDNRDGLRITNNKGESWKTYGDRSLFINDNSESIKRAIIAMQRSADQIYAAYRNKQLDLNAAVAVATLELPNFAAITRDPANKPPLFTIDRHGSILEYSNGQYRPLWNCLSSAGWHGYYEYL